MRTRQAEWYEPSVDEVADGVYRIPLPLPTDGLRAVNVYLITGGDSEPACIDSGWSVPEAREVLINGLATLRLGLADIRRFLVTHIHRDHFTQAITIRQETQTRIALGEGERPALGLLCGPADERVGRRWDQLVRNGGSELAARLRKAWSAHPEPLFPFEFPDEWLSDGDVVDVPGRRLDVIETPGHTRGHVVFHDTAGRLLFAGDHVLSTITPSIGLDPAPTPSPNVLGDFLESLARVRKLPDAVLLPAHGPIRPSAHARVDELIAHHALRLDGTLAALRAGDSTAFEVAGRLKWTRHERGFDELDMFNQSLAVTETVAHLKLLEAQGRAQRKHENGTDHYGPS
jgi:glyoxylase-like metal-dependent hydrolase (beta-lactamase superfamily II)